jgi:hypothetical protein
MAILDYERRRAVIAHLRQRKACIVIGAGIVVALLVILHFPGLNGPWYWKWAYRRLPASPLYFAMGVASLPILGAQFVWKANHHRAARLVALLLLVIGGFSLKLASVMIRTSPPSLLYIPAMVTDEHAFSYYTDALGLSQHPTSEWIANYPELMWQLHTHTKIKPPGLVLYWVTMIHTFDRLAGPLPDYYPALYGGLGLGILGVLSIPAAYLMLATLLGDRGAAFAAASFLSLCPGFVLFFPTFDPAYILISSAMIGSWFLALRDDATRWSMALGVVLGLMLFVIFNLLVLGAFMLALILYIRARERSVQQRLRIAAKHAAIAGGVVLVVLGILYVGVEYDPLATLRSAWKTQNMQLALHPGSRPYPYTILFDLTDFLLGSGWISAGLVACYFISEPRDRRTDQLVWLALGQLLLVAVTGLLQCETARVWNFMLPLLLLPVGLEMSRWSLGQRVGVLAVLALITATIHQNMLFIY